MISFGKIKFEGAGAEKIRACGRHVEDAFPGRFCYFYDPKKINVGVCYSNPNHKTGKYLP